MSCKNEKRSVKNIGIKENPHDVFKFVQTKFFALRFYPKTIDSTVKIVSLSSACSGKLIWDLVIEEKREKLFIALYMVMVKQAICLQIEA